MDIIKRELKKYNSKLRVNDTVCLDTDVMFDREINWYSKYLNKVGIIIQRKELLVYKRGILVALRVNFGYKTVQFNSELLIFKHQTQ
jgi:hypothetical protein